jgi:ethanolamine utilization protein EutA
VDESHHVSLIGLDFGTTTSSAVVASARLERRWASGRSELEGIEERYRSEIVFTPFRGNDIDVERAGELVDGWLAAAGVSTAAIFGGGAIITGLAARRTNAAHLARLIRARIGDAVMAIADDPCLESWMAFMGSAVELSRARPETPVMNVDIGGGTTNLALGLGGDVIRVGCLFVGARHVEVAPGTYRLVRLSEQARALFDHLGIRKREGESLAPEEVRAVVDFQVALIEAEVEGHEEPFATPADAGRRRASADAAALGARLRQVALRLPSGLPRAALTLSGGVGELVYRSLKGEALPETTHYGDLGIDLTRRILASRCLMRDVLVPASTGRATSYGLLRHSTQVSGATIFLPDPEALPLTDIPILRRLSSAAPAVEIERTVELARRSPRGGCIQIRYEGRGPEALKELGQRISSALAGWSLSPPRPLVILLSEDVGKALGGYISRWGREPMDVLVIDEIAPRDAQFVQIGRAHGEVVPVSFYGMSPRRESP